MKNSEFRAVCINLVASEGAWRDAVKRLNASGYPAPAGIALAIEQAKAALAEENAKERR